MKIVIDIPEEIYSYVNTQWKDIPKNDSPISILCNAVIDGAPLPKGHGRLGDLDELEQRIIRYVEHHAHMMDEMVLIQENFIIDGIKQTPTIIEPDKAESEDEICMTYGYCAYHEMECDYKGSCINCPHNTAEDTEWFRQDEERFG